MSGGRNEPFPLKIMEDWIIPQSVFGAISRGIFLTGMIDLVYLDSIILQYTIALSRSYSEVLTLSFSGLLVLLYFEQHRTQKKQREISEKQIEIQQSQIAIQREKNSPEIVVNEFEAEAIEVSSDTPYYKQLISTFILENAGDGSAKDLEIEFDILLNFDDTRSYFHAANYGVYTFPAPLYSVSSIGDEGIEHDLESSKSLGSGRVQAYVSMTPISYTPYTGPAKNAEDGSGFTIPTHHSESFGEALSHVELDVDSVIIRAKLKYSEIGDQEEEKSITSVKIEPDSSISIVEAINEGEYIEPYRYTVSEDPPYASRYFPEF